MSVFLGPHNIISPLGYSSRENFEAVLNGKSALENHQFKFSEGAFCCSLINEAELDKKFSTIGLPAEFTHLEKISILSITDVLKQSGIDLSDKNNLLILSTTKGNIDVLENRYKSIPLQRAYLPEFSATIGRFFKCSNLPLIVSNACISGLLAMIIAKRFLENKTYKNIIVCGADIISEFTLAGFKSFNALSEQPCKPFDAARKGINLGEAAASIVLSVDNISDIIIASGASANDANHISGPSRNGDGLFKAVERALKMSGRNTVDFISAHGTATEYNDEMESVAFSRAGLNLKPVNSLKGYYGHTLGAAGVLESVITVLSLSNNMLVSSAGFDTPGTSQPLNVIKQNKQMDLQNCLKTASGFGGCNAAVVFEKI